MNVAMFCTGAAVALTLAHRTDSVVAVSAMTNPINAAASRPMTIPSLVRIVVDRFVAAVKIPLCASEVLIVLTL